MNRKSMLALIIIGLSGQIAWTIENMYFNVFMYNEISTDPGYIAAMVASSAIVATLTTLVMGTLSDKLGRRKIFISLGYIIWSLTVFAFAFINPALGNAAILVVVLDCVMTFFGSSANDAAFNAYITETVESSKRAKVEAVVQVLPMVAMLFVFGVMDSFTQRGDWKSFFSITAAIMLAAGILSVFLLEKDKGEKKDVKLFSSVVRGFRKEAVKDNPLLYIALTAYAVNALSMQIFFPYLIIYIQTYLGFRDNYVILLGITLVVASVFCIIGGKSSDRLGRTKSAFMSVSLMALGLVMMYTARSFVYTTISGIVMMSGYLISSSVLSSLVRDYTPKGREGETQGIRMIFSVMLPMIIGPYIGAIAIKGSNLTYVELGVTKTVPTPLIFLLGAAVELLAFIPLVALRRKEERI